MIQYNNQNSFKEIHYNGHDIQKAYCDTGDLVWQKQSPGPTPFEGKWLATYDGGSTSSAECDSTSTISQYEISLTNLLDVQIGDCVTSIGDNAFSNCTSLSSVTIGSGATSIGSWAFADCSSLTSVTIPDSVTSIGVDAFSNCTSLSSVTIGSGATSIGDTAFEYCISLTSCTIGSGATSIGNGAFYSCSGLTSIDIPNSVTSIGNGVFYGCSGLTSVTVLATQPPTLGMFSFNDTNNCPIYVPTESVDTYKSATNWSTYVDRIQAIPNS